MLLKTARPCKRPRAVRKLVVVYRCRQDPGFLGAQATHLGKAPSMQHYATNPAQVHPRLTGKKWPRHSSAAG